VTVVKKVASATNVDVDVLVKAGYRAAQIEQDLISQVIVCCNNNVDASSCVVLPLAFELSTGIQRV
jgi:hypothetical protein